MRRSSGLRSRLLEAALRLFVARGFRGTSLQDIASEVGCSKASLLYHFASKEAILAELLAPAGEAMGKLVTGLSVLPDDLVAGAAVEGFVDLALDFRGEISLMLADAEQTAGALHDEHHPALTERLLDALCGRSGRPQDRLRAWLVVGGIAVAVAAGPELPREETRELLIDGALGALGDHPRG